MIAAGSWEGDSYPHMCDNCWSRSSRANPVREDSWSGRYLCRRCEPHPIREGHAYSRCAECRRRGRA